MRAVRYYAAKDIRVDHVAEPDGDLGPHELLVGPRWVGICGTDLHEYMAGPIVTPADPHPLTGAQLPQILGHEFSALVHAVGSDVTATRPGDRITIMPLAYCGHCYYCRRALNHLCVRMGCVGLSWQWGGLSDLAVIMDYHVGAVLPDEVSDEQGALIEPTAVADYGVSRGEVRPGDSVLVTGAGPIGALAVLCSLAAGAGAVYLSEPNPRRVERARDLGAAATFNPQDTDVAGEIKEMTDGIGVDVAIECAGNERALQTCVDATRKHGRVVQTGLHVGPASVTPMVWSEHDLSIIGTWCYRVFDFPRITAQIASGALPVEKVVTGHTTLEQAVPEGFDVLVDPEGDQIKVLVSADGKA